MKIGLFSGNYIKSEVEELAKSFGTKIFIFSTIKKKKF